MATGGNHHHTSSPSSGLKGLLTIITGKRTRTRTLPGLLTDDGSLDKSEDCPNYYDVYDSGRAPNISDLKYGPSRPHQVVLSPAWGSVPALSTEPLHEAGGKKGGGCCSENGGRVAIGMFGIAMGVLGSWHILLFRHLH
ncbi:Uncharacterized protein FKW44_007605 [Caligus rogercresseyi]|uniref:Uncharacterized protein n=1 Tax=Caligus rogercresseyi TaxID=217165 RepID=A0A7T8KF11_CALRO|nr:Uncharacterized protein FKW44_007605 [Caligus rogercresseyi]